MESEGEASEGAAKDRFDTGVWIPVLIGLVSVTVALLAWRSSQLNENATDADRAALADAAFVRQAELQAEVFATNAQTVDIQIQVLGGEARLLREDAARGGTAASQQIARAEELEAEVAQLRLFQNRAPSDEALGEPFDVAGNAAATLAGNRELGRHDPEVDQQTGVRLRDRSLRLALLTVVLAFAVLLLTGAQVARRRRVQATLLAVAVVAWVVAIGGALGTGLR